MFARVKVGLVAFAAIVMFATAARAQYVVCPDEFFCNGVDPSGGSPQYVSPPDMTLQIAVCSSDAGAFIEPFRSAIVSAMQELDFNHDDPPPNPEVRLACVNGRSTFGAWLQPVGSYGLTDTATARNVGLSRVNLLVNNETFAFQFTPIGTARLVAIRWRDQPRRLNDAGAPDPSGPVHLTGFGLLFQNEDALQRRIVDLAVSGVYDGIQDTDFILHIYDFLTLSTFGEVGQPQCETTAFAEPTETTIDSVLSGLTGNTRRPMGDVVGEGPGCTIAKRLPRTVLLAKKATDPVARKIVFTYTRINSYQSSGLIFGGTFAVLERQPFVTVQGPISILAEPGEYFRGTFTASLNDLRYPYTVSWTSLNATPVSGSARATMTWSLPTLAVGSQVGRMVSVRITDADGLTATGYKGVVLKRVADATPVSTLCKSKPWLAECQ
jgi:hypothetical protein